MARPSEINYIYDASGNKLQKQVEIFGCPPLEPCPGPATATTDYIGNFENQNEHLKMVYHPEGVIRPTPPSAENTTEYVYDYFIKDYPSSDLRTGLGNVRVVLTEEKATYDTSPVASRDTRVLGMPFGIPGEGYARSAYRAAWEEDVFDNIDEGRGLKPDNYPLDESFPLNFYIAEACPEAARRVVAKNDMTIGPSKVLNVQRGQLVKGAVRYFYEENAPGQTYDNLGFLVHEILVSMAAAGAGVLPWGENQLIDLAAGNTDIGAGIFEFLSTEMDTTRMQSPHGYLIWLAYDEDLNLDPSSSGAVRVVDPNELGTLLTGQVKINKDGYLHVYVSNGTASKVINFDNFYITTMQGQTRQINHYYPFGMRMRPLSGKKYNNLYTGKELQTGEYWDPSFSTGLEMYDFEARFFDPQLGRWMVPDPAEQFSNPYLAMGNNPVYYTDPDGEFVFTALLIGMAYGALIGAGTSAAVYSATAGINGNWNWNDFGKTVAFGAVGGALGGGLGYVGSQIGTFGQSLGYNVLSNVASNSATTLSFGGDVTAGGLVGMAVGGAIGAGIGNFKGVSGSAGKNIGAELGFGAAKGAVSGAFGGAIGAGIDGQDVGQGFMNGAKYGAIAGASLAGLNIISMGAAYKPDRQYGDFGREGPVYRRGTFLTRAIFGASGVTIGRNLVINRANPKYTYRDPDTGWPLIPSKLTQEIEAHETYHYIQQRQLGFGNFYARTLSEYIKYSPINTYCTPGTLEWDADMFGIQQLGNSIYR